MESDEAYEGREQSQIKHKVLRNYLERFAHIIGNHWPSITYVDCFSGPWKSTSETHSDTSFAIAVAELCKARSDLEEARSKTFQIRCFFIEERQTAFQQLKTFAQSKTDSEKSLEILVKNSRLEDAVPDVVDFIHRDPQTFPFIFIDPTGWTGFGLPIIRPLLTLKPGEILINFMTHHINRFATSVRAGDKRSFAQLYGDTEYFDEIRASAPGRDREGAIVNTYMKRIREAGSFPYAAKAYVLHPERDQTHFNLIYATRDRRGLQEFKRSEARAMRDAESIRLKKRHEKRTSEGQNELFSYDDVQETSEYYSTLRETCVSATHRILESKLQSEGILSYEDLFDLALLTPLFWESDLRAWIRKQRDAGRLQVVGLKPRERTPKLNHNHSIQVLNK